MSLRYRFTLSHSSGSQVISEPDGWRDIRLILDRDPDYHSLIEFFEAPLIFYGNNGTHDGGMAFVLNVIRNYGLNENVEILVEVSEDDSPYVLLFDGLLNLESYRIIDERKLQCGILRNDLWSKFKNREETPVDIQSTTDLDGNSISSAESITVNLPSQKINKTLSVEASDSQIGSISNAPGSGSGQDLITGIGFDVEILKELVEFSFLGSAISVIPDNSVSTYFTDNSLYFLKVEEIISGTIDIQVSYEFVASRNSGVGQDGIGMRWYFKVRSGETITAYELSNSYVGGDAILTDSAGNATFFKTHFLSQSINLVPGDELFLYGELLVSTAFGANHNYEIYYGDNELSYITFNAQTSFPASTSESFFIHDVGGAIIDRITGYSNSFFSQYLGGIDTIYRQYGTNGCGFGYSLQKGLQIRGYTLDQKPFFLSFNEWWTGINPILNLGLSYSADSIIVEDKAYFYDTDTIINFSWVNGIEENPDKDVLFKKVSIGYNKWQSEDIRGLDDPQTKHTYATIFKTIGKEFAAQSTFIAASLAIEITRRKTIEKTADYKFDNDTFIIALNPTEVSAGVYQPELDENFSNITNLLNSETRYNLKLTPTQNLIRWLNYLSGCLQSYLSSDFRFVSGEGNFDFGYQNNDPCLDGYTDVALTEKDDISVSETYLHSPELYEFEYPLTWTEYQTIRDNRTNAIGVSTTDADHQICFIKRIEYDINRSKAKFVVWKR